MLQPLVAKLELQVVVTLISLPWWPSVIIFMLYQWAVGPQLSKLLGVTVAVMVTSGCNIDQTTLVAQDYHLQAFSIGSWTRVIKVTRGNSISYGYKWL